MLYYYISILLRPKYAAKTNSKCRKGRPDDCAAWRLNRNFVGFCLPRFGNKKNHVHIGSHFRARHPHSLGTRCCGSGGVNTAATSVGARSFQGDSIYCIRNNTSIIKLRSATLKKSDHHQSPPRGMAF